MNKTQLLLEELQSRLTQNLNNQKMARSWTPDGDTICPLSKPNLQEDFGFPQDSDSAPDVVEGDMKTPPLKPLTTPDNPGGETTGPLLRKDPPLQDEKTPSSSTKGIRARCQVWLEARLSDGPIPLWDVKKEARQLGYTPKALRVARAQLRVQPIPCLVLPVDGHS